MMPELGYDPKKLPRELTRHYISATEKEIAEMLKEVGVAKLEDLYQHIPDEIKFGSAFDLPEELSYEDLQKHLYDISQKNKKVLGFVGDGLQSFALPSLVKDILGIRGLTTAYTPYQPERSQGTLLTHWIYASLIAQLTGFEAINASMYDRSTALFEALNCALRIHKDGSTAIILGSIYPGDRQVLETHVRDTKLKLVFVECDAGKGVVSLEAVKKKALEIGKDLAVIAFPQVNYFGNLENVDGLTDLAKELGAQSIAIIEPILIASAGLKPPSLFGENGCNMFVGEGQTLALPPIYGGPGLGVFGIRFNEKDKTSVRSTAGRFIGAGKDQYGKDCKLLVLSTREQHIRREKATSNICSNQAYVATLAGAVTLAKGEEGLKAGCTKARKNAISAFEKLTAIVGVEAAFPNTAFFNEFTLKLPMAVGEFITKCTNEGVLPGVDVSKRLANGGNLILVSLSDIQTDKDIDQLVQLFKKVLKVDKNKPSSTPAEIPEKALRKTSTGIIKVDEKKVIEYYNKLGDLNATPDDCIYPLGSCTMKYNPYINDYAAALDGFLSNHPESPESLSQGSMEVIYHVQEWLKKITGLPGVTTQPLAGAQGELAAIKMFQAYHLDRGDHGRDIVLIPGSAHGTNPATTTVAGFETKVEGGVAYGVVKVESDATGRVDMNHLESLIATYGKRISCIMVTNPNTSGIMESNFKILAEKIHSVGGLVYMDGANMNAIAGWVDLSKMGVDAVHQNLHKTWSIPHGGGGPGDGAVCVSQKLIDFLPGLNIVKDTSGKFSFLKQPKSIGSFHRHFGNFGHKVRCYTYMARLGKQGVRRMSAVAVLSARYLHKKLSAIYPTLPKGAEKSPRMHEFIITLPEELFKSIEAAGVPRVNIIARIGKLFLDFGFHAPTVAFPESFGLMIEPTESYTKVELDRLADTVKAIYELISEHPEVLQTVPHFTPIARVDDVTANKALCLSETITALPEIGVNSVPMAKLRDMPFAAVKSLILEAHKARK
jgi:glycine dehydrogenase